MTLALNIRPYTIIQIVAPSGSNEDLWCDLISKKIVDKINKKPIFIDGNSNNLEEEIRSKTKYPNLEEFIIIKGNNFSAEVREKVRKISNDINYETVLVYFYMSKKHLVNLTNEERASHNIFRKDVLENLSLKEYKRNFAVQSFDKKYWEQLNLEINDLDIYSNTKVVLDPDVNYVFIGDVHESVDALANLVKDLKHIPNKKYVFVGDLFDKGLNTANMLTVVESFLSKDAIFLEGNHESYLAKRLLNLIKVANVEQEYFTALEELTNNPLLKDRFLAFHEKCFPFLRFGVMEDGKFVDKIYVSHAPVEEKFMYKLDTVSLKNQRNYSFGSFGKDVEFMKKELSFMNTEASEIKPLHIFGHIAHEMNNLQEKNKIWLDTGAVHGGRLTAVIYHMGEDLKYVSVPAKKLSNAVLFPGWDKKLKLKV